MRFGDQLVALVTGDATPAGLIPLALDHLALRVPDARKAARDFGANGARLHTGFTPEGPRDIPQFWEHGVRFVFFEGPDGVPLEFCQKLGAEAASAPLGHDHYALRARDLAPPQAVCAALGATTVATHLLEGEVPVSVRFLARGNEIFELFDEGPFPAPGLYGWIGLLPDPGN